MTPCPDPIPAPRVTLETILRESERNGTDPAQHPARHWWPCTTCRSWHPGDAYTEVASG